MESRLKRINEKIPNTVPLGRPKEARIDRTLQSLYFFLYCNKTARIIGNRMPMQICRKKQQ